MKDPLTAVDPSVDTKKLLVNVTVAMIGHGPKKKRKEHLHINNFSSKLLYCYADHNVDPYQTL